MSDVHQSVLNGDARAWVRICSQQDLASLTENIERSLFGHVDQVCSRWRYRTI
jgi:hypothetical protein